MNGNLKAIIIVFGITLCIFAIRWLLIIHYQKHYPKFSVNPSVAKPLIISIFFESSKGTSIRICVIIIILLVICLIFVLSSIWWLPMIGLGATKS